MPMTLLQRPLFPLYQRWLISTKSMVSMNHLIALWYLSCWQELIIWEQSLMSACLSLPVHSRVVHALPTVFVSWYKCLMFQAMMVPFKTYLQIGKIVPRSRGMIRGCLHMGDVLMSRELITISLRRFKHSGLSTGFSVRIPRWLPNATK